MTIIIPLKTEFAPAKRASEEKLKKQVNHFSSLPSADLLLSSVPESVMILNQDRQIVYANSAFKALLGMPGDDSLIGSRLGEAIHCEHAFETAGGCGTTRFCSTCGAVKAILKAQTGCNTVEECRITVRDEIGRVNSLDLRVSTVPQTIQNEQFIVFSMTDISDEKRRVILERIFFHDITNTAGAIYGLAEIIKDIDSIEELETFGMGDMLTEASNRLIDEIQTQRQLMAAENGDLTVLTDSFYTNTLLDELQALYKNHAVAKNRILRVDDRTENVLIKSDRAMLGRVISNMIKNALEASKPQETVTMGCQYLFDYVRVWVHNPQPMPQHVQLQIFQRSFSTKGNGRGLGTYSMKLLSENYLQGRVSFESNPEYGTTFAGMFPLELCETPIN